MENIIWQEVINSGNVRLAFDYFNSGTSSSAKSEINFLKLLADSSRKDIQPFEQFVIRFAEQKLDEFRESNPAFWNVILILSKTQSWRNIAERVLNSQEEDFKIEDDDESDKTSRAGYNEFGNHQTVTSKIIVSLHE